ncbi:MAG TPA: MerR family transcriptional regulator [Baekduia sp.]|nr:MerR family transcriptional regulator [Baekduia sp.]
MHGAIRTTAAAAMLGVSPSTLRAWERRFGFPAPLRSEGGHRRFSLAEIEALRAAFLQTPDAATAIAIARGRGAGPATDVRLLDALRGFDEDACDRLLEESLALRSVERTVAEVLLPAVTALGDEPTAEVAFAHRWAGGWLAGARRVAPPASHDAGVLIFDAGAPLHADALHAHALELVLRRGGLRTLVLTAALDPTRLGRALRALAPRAVVLTGRGASLDTLARLVFAARRAGREGVAVLDFRGAVPARDTSLVERLPEDPLAARDRLLAVVAEPAAASRRRRAG